MFSLVRKQTFPIITDHFHTLKHATLRVPWWVVQCNRALQWCWEVQFLGAWRSGVWMETPEDFCPWNWWDDNGAKGWYGMMYLSYQFEKLFGTPESSKSQGRWVFQAQVFLWKGLCRIEERNYVFLGFSFLYKIPDAPCREYLYILYTFALECGHFSPNVGKCFFTSIWVWDVFTLDREGPLSSVAKTESEILMEISFNSGLFESSGSWNQATTVDGWTPAITSWGW